MKKYILFFFLLATLTSKATITDSMAVHVFFQGGANNCVSVALIKAAINKYGYRNIFGQENTAGGIRITLKDSTVFVLTKDEIAQAAGSSKFMKTGYGYSVGKEADQVLDYANLCYAVMAKSIQVNGVWGCENYKGESFRSNGFSYTEALSLLSSTGICTDNCYRLLGLQINGGINEYSSFVPMPERKGIILYNSHHAVFFNNYFFDCFGQAVPIGPEIFCSGSKFKPGWYLELK